NLARDILLKQGLLAILKSLDLFLIFRGFRSNRIQTDAPVCTDGKDSFQLCFYGPPNDLFQFLSVDFQIVAWTGFIRLGAAAMEIGLLVCDIGKCVVTAAAEHNAFQKDNPSASCAVGKNGARFPVPYRTKPYLRLRGGGQE